MTSGASSAGHPLDRRPEHYVGAEGEQPAEAEPTPGKVGWINVYQRANGESSSSCGTPQPSKYIRPNVSCAGK